MFDLRSFITVGHSAIVEKNVTKADTAANYGTGRLGELLATPALVKLMIKAAVEAVDTNLPDGIVSVGQAMQFIHTSPSVIGASVRVQAKVIELNGNSVILEIIAWDDIGEIGTGQYERSIVILDELLRKAHERAVGMVQNHP